MRCVPPSYKALLLLLAVLGWLGFPGTAQAEPSSPTAHLNAGYPRVAFTDVDLKDAQAALEMWTRQVTKVSEFPMTTKVSIYPDELAIAEAFQEKKLDLGILSTSMYLKIKDKVFLDPVFVPSCHNHVGDEYLLVVHRESGITSVKQLQGRKILMHPRITPLSIHILWVNWLLKQQGLPPYERFFGGVKEMEKPSQAILPVFFKKAEACLVMRRVFQTVTELNPQMGQDLVIIAQSPPLLRGIIVFRRDYSDKIKQAVSKTLAELHTHPQGKQILTLLKYDKLVTFKTEYLHSLAPFYYGQEQASVVLQKPSKNRGD